MHYAAQHAPRRRLEHVRDLQVEISSAFIVFVIATAGLAAVCLSWLLLVILHPGIDSSSEARFCQLRGRRLRQTTQVLLLSLSASILVRCLVFLPRVAARVEEVWSERVSWAHFYVSVLSLHFPLGLFTFTSWLHWYQVFHAPWCDSRFGAFVNQASLCCLLSFMGIALATWHGYMIQDAAAACDDPLPFVQVTFTARSGARLAQEASPPSRQPGSHPDASFMEADRWLELLLMLDCLSTVHFDGDTFGDEEGKLYASECVICLNQFESSDVIRQTRCCGHLYHEECLGRWLAVSKTARCAVCRRPFLDGKKRRVDLPGRMEDGVQEEEEEVPLPGNAGEVAAEEGMQPEPQVIGSSELSR